MTEKRNLDCALSQDLMPLELDRLCSAESSAFLRKHLKTCAECSRIFDSLCADDGTRAAPAAAEDPVRSLRSLRRFFRRRTARNTLITVAALLIAAVLSYGLYLGLWGDTSIPLPLDRYDVSLKQTSDGFVFLNVSYDGTARGYIGSSGLAGGPDDTGAYIFSYYETSSRIPRRQAADGSSVTIGENFFYLYEGQLYDAWYRSSFDNYWLELAGPVDEIRQGKGNQQRVIYRAGDAIPICSAEEEEALNASLWNSVYRNRTVLPGPNALFIPLPGKMPETLLEESSD